MLKSNLLEGGSTNIRLSSSAFDVLVEDCFRYGYLKKGKANISYIISRLAKELTEYRIDLHEELLKNNKGNIELVKNIETNIFNIYLKKLNYICDDSYVNVGYRTSKEFMPYIKDIFYEILEKFDIDFASYIRSIIHEYCSRTITQRELFLNYSLIKLIRNSIKQGKIVNIVNDGIQDNLLVVAIEQNECGFNYMLGITPDRTMSLFLPLSKTERLVVTKNKMSISDDDYDKILSNFSKFVEENK